MLQNNSSQLQNKHLVQALRQKCLVLFQRQLSQKPLSELFAEIDRSGNGYVEIIELRKYLLKNGIDSTEEDLHEFLQIMDTDYDNKVKLNEFYDFVMEKQGVGQQPGQSQIKATQNVVNVFKYAVLDYMKKNNFGFSHIFQLLNQKKDNRLKENDIQDFCNYQLQMRLSQIDMNTIFNYFDENQDSVIDLNEFLVNLRSFAKNDSNREKYRTLFKGEREPLHPPTISAIVNSICLYMNKYNIQLAKLYSDLDANGNGTLDKSEFRQLFQKMGVKLDDSQFSGFFDHFDVNKDDRIQVQEFYNVIEPEIKKMQSMNRST